MGEQRGFFVSGGRAAWALIGAVVIVGACSAVLFQSTVSARY